MPVSNVWTDPSAGGTLDLTAGTIVTEAYTDAIASNFLYLGGSAGIITQFNIFTASVSGPSTTSNTMVPMGDPNVSFTTLSGSKLLVFAQLCVSNSTVGAVNSFFLGIDGSSPTPTMSSNQKVAGYNEIITLIAAQASVPATTHTISVYWATNAGTLTRVGTQCSIMVLEIRK